MNIGPEYNAEDKDNAGVHNRSHFLVLNEGKTKLPQVSFNSIMRPNMMNGSQSSRLKKLQK